MYELIQVSSKFYYIQSPAKIGLIKTGEDTVCLIDSGNNKDAGKRVMKHLEAKGWSLQAIYNTHSHADHIGGNSFLQSRTGCKVYAPGIERDLTEHTLLEPSFIYGANAPEELRHKFILAQGCDALPLSQDCLPQGVELIPLPGHSFDMVGFRTDEDVVYLADCLSGEATIEKYGISFIFDVQAYLETLNAVKNMRAKVFVPAHAEPTENIAPLAQLNIDRVMSIGDRIVDICSAPVSFEVLLKRLFDAYGLTMNFEQYALVGSTVRSYLTWLKGQGRLTAVFEDNMLLWQAC